MQPAGLEQPFCGKPLTGCFCGCRPLCKKFLTVRACDRVRTSVRPQYAAFPEAAGRDGDQRIGSTSEERALRLAAACWFSQSGSVRSFCPFRSSSSHTPWHRHWRFDMSIMPRLPAPDPCNSRPSSASPRSAAPSCWPARSRPASWACAPTCVPASCPPVLCAAQASPVATWHR